jgi:hypothetical protein
LSDGDLHLDVLLDDVVNDYLDETVANQRRIVPEVLIWILFIVKILLRTSAILNILNIILQEIDIPFLILISLAILSWLLLRLLLPLLPLNETNRGSAYRGSQLSISDGQVELIGWITVSILTAKLLHSDSDDIWDFLNLDNIYVTERSSNDILRWIVVHDISLFTHKTGLSVALEVLWTSILSLLGPCIHQRCSFAFQ